MEKQRVEASLCGGLVDALLILLSPILLSLLVVAMPLIVVAMAVLEIVGLKGDEAA